MKNLPNILSKFNKDLRKVNLVLQHMGKLVYVHTRNSRNELHKKLQRQVIDSTQQKSGLNDTDKGVHPMKVNTFIRKK